MLKFLSGLAQKNKKPLLFVTTTALAIGVGIWSFDLLKLVPTGTLPPLTQWQIRIFLTLILISVWLLTLLAITGFSYKKEIETESYKQPQKIETNKKETLEDQFKRSILVHILKMRGVNEIASPKNIAKKMNQDPEIILAHLRKLHSEQFVTFITGGLQPTVDTDFFLSPDKAFEIIKIDATQQVTQGDG